MAFIRMEQEAANKAQAESRNSDAITAVLLKTSPPFGFYLICVWLRDSLGLSKTIWPRCPVNDSN
jgi:hypothetical protein